MNVHDAAAYITANFDSGISTMKLQKLCFYAQGWTLALLDQPLFPEEFQAWRNGPVCYELFVGHRGNFSVSSWPQGDPSNIGKRERIVLDAMLSNFGALTGLQLSDLTHKKGTPWAVVRDQAGTTQGGASNEVISQNSIQSYFKSSLRPGV